MRSFRRPCYEILYYSKVSPQPAVCLLRKGLEVDIEGIDQRQHLFKYMRHNASVCNRHIFHSPFFSLQRGIPDVFITDHRFVICEGKPYVSLFPQFFRHHGQFPGRKAPRSDIILRSRGNRVVLTEWAVHVTAEGADREDPASRMESCKGFFFDRIQCYRCQLAVTEGDVPVSPVAPCFAEASFAFFDIASARTDVTDHLSDTSRPRNAAV